MERILILRASYLASYLHALRRFGFDPAALLSRHRLPAGFEFLPDYVIPGAALHGFVRDATSLAQPGVISAEAGLHHAAGRHSPFVDRLRSAVTLLDAMRFHNESVARHSPENAFELAVCEHGARWSKLGYSPLAETEAFCVANLVGHVRRIAGSGWKPAGVGVSVVPPEHLARLPLLAGVPVGAISRNTVIEVPAVDLGMRVAPGAVAAASGDQLPLEPDALDFVGSLRLVLLGYARQGVLTVDVAAEAAGMSRRTLQRRLGAQGLTFSRLAEQIRFEIARTRLESDDEASVTQIGFDLGYADPGSFSRAFRRFAGVAPVTYRRNAAGGQRSVA